MEDDKTTKKKYEISPKPWTVHYTGSTIGLKDANGKFVIRKTVNSISHDDYFQLEANLKHIAFLSNYAPMNERPISDLPDDELREKLSTFGNVTSRRVGNKNIVTIED